MDSAPFQASFPARSLTSIVVFDIDGVIRDVGNSYRRALADTVEHFTAGAYRPSQAAIDTLKAEGMWNNDWEASQEFVYRYFEGKLALGETEARPEKLCSRDAIALNYEALVAFFQSRYRGPDPVDWTGYICQEPLLVQSTYLDGLTEAGIQWGFFSGATTGSARFVLEKRLGLRSPILVAMEDAPGKPDPTGLLKTVEMLNGADPSIPVIYVGDTVADMYTVDHARKIQPNRNWIGVGILPPHVQETEDQQTAYTTTLQKAGAVTVLGNVEELTPTRIQTLGKR